MPEFRCRQCGRETLIPLAYCEDYFGSEDSQIEDGKCLTTCPRCAQAARRLP